MEPRRENAAEIFNAEEQGKWEVLPQWAAARAPRRYAQGHDRRDGRRAAMGPRRGHRGDVCPCVQRDLAEEVAAMEPQPEGCGGLNCGEWFTPGFEMPQWSRSRRAAERAGDLYGEGWLYTAPQWNRSLKAAEKSSVSGCPLPRLVQPQWSRSLMAAEKTRHSRTGIRFFWSRNGAAA
jgi:hypothetical protein